MKSFGIMIKKELNESLKGKRMLALLIVGVFFALLSPLTAKFLPVIFEQLTKGQDMGGMTVMMSGEAPKYTDAYAQFFKNFSQMGVIIVMVVFMGIVSNEKSKGTAVLVLTKCVPRHVFILSKFITSVVVFTASYVVSIGIYLYYTYLLFNKAIDGSTLPAFLFLWLFVVFMLSLALLSSTLAKSTSMSAMIIVISTFVLLAVSGLPVIRDYSPMNLAGFPYPFPQSDVFGAYLTNIATSVILSVVLVVASVAAFRKQEI